MAARTGTAAADTMTGGMGSDTLWGNLGDDLLRGGGGDDLLVGGFGADRLVGGGGDDVLQARSDAGEPDSAQRPGFRQQEDNFQIAFDPAFLPHDDTLTGGSGADTFAFEVFVNARPQLTLLHRHESGVTDWMEIAMTRNGTVANPVVHYHWADGIGDDTITDFRRGEGDRITLTGHTIDVLEIRHEDADGDGDTDSVVELFSFSATPGGKAHQGDRLGSITVLDVADLALADLAVDKAPVFGAFARPEDVGGIAGLREAPFQTDDTGVLPGQGFPGEQPWMMG